MEIIDCPVLRLYWQKGPGGKMTLERSVYRPVMTCSYCGQMTMGRILYETNLYDTLICPECVPKLKANHADDTCFEEFDWGFMNPDGRWLIAELLQEDNMENEVAMDKDEYPNGEELIRNDLVPVAKDTDYDLQPQAQLVPEAKPAEVIERAREQASAIMDVVEQQKLYQVIRGKKYIMVEGWQLLAAFNGLRCVIESTERIEGDNGSGWQARCVIYNANGEQVGAGEAECLDTEKNWKGRDDYAIRSMAQTRAISKACRTILSFVVVLAGYEPTPAEEMIGVFDDKDDGKEQLIVTIRKLSSKERIDAFLAKHNYQSLDDVPAKQLKAIVKKLKGE